MKCDCCCEWWDCACELMEIILYAINSETQLSLYQRLEWLRGKLLCLAPEMEQELLEAELAIQKNRRSEAREHLMKLKELIEVYLETID